MRLARQAIAKSTHNAYQKSLAHFRKFARFNKMKTSLPIHQEDLACFLTYLYEKQLGFSTISSISSGISYHHKLLNMVDPTKSYIIKQILISVKKKRPTSDKRVPMTDDLLISLVNTVDRLNNAIYEKTLLKTMFIFAFVFGTRISEITKNKHNLQFQQVEITDEFVSVNFQSYKHSNGNQVYLKCYATSSDICPVKALKEYVMVRGSKQGPFFKLKGKAVPQRFYNDRLKHICKKLKVDNISSHSFRIGAASKWAQQGLSEIEIKRRGRWSTNAYKSYIRGSVEVN